MNKNEKQLREEIEKAEKQLKDIKTFILFGLNEAHTNIDRIKSALPILDVKSQREVLRLVQKILKMMYIKVNDEL